MNERREFVKASLCAGISLVNLPLPEAIFAQSKTNSQPTPIRGSTQSLQADDNTAALAFTCRGC